MTVNRLYFAQHGLAVDKAEDAERPLSTLGIDQSHLVATQLYKQQVTISKIVHSGKLRAAQTADIFAERLKVGTVSNDEHLSPNADITQIIKTLDTDSVLFVGHLPHLDKLSSYLITGDETSKVIHFQNSGILCLENQSLRYQVRWYLTPTFC